MKVGTLLEELSQFDYDDNLYEILTSYVLDEPDSYYNMLDFIHDRREQF